MTTDSPTALLVDDEVAIRRMIRIALESQDWRVIEAGSVRSASVEAAMTRPDVILLDLGLPDGEGVDVVRTVRSWSDVPIIVITARDAEHEKVALLDAGADDYITKPFSIPELLARMRAHVRRRARTETQADVVIGPLSIDLAGHVVMRDGERIHLTATEFAVLRVLASNAGRVVTNHHILRSVWGPGAQEEMQYVRVYIAALRKKLEVDPDRPLIIRTEIGVGYRMVP
ncbi:MAG: response regulator ['Candidatus Kapabacteria' thiocyanatum]|uniref:DNA-binding response regulator n=1 Tax=Candidatus Kapaibacterium thiocyanatum TaxID=1895771 RepID=A0A1M3KXG0_9BACT|nr:response regulator ['Candidatus Kapabacteria' thiocyanatum]OJX57098.1 MAG: hypothetical protein BGO89_11375 ['Candidatus Kapabacteria' thiocyanatum]